MRIIYLSIFLFFLYALPAYAEEETSYMPDYPKKAKLAVGEMKTYIIGEEDTLMDIARHYNLGFIELRSANNNIDPWTPMPDKEIILPLHHILPRSEQNGIVINLGEMRLFHFLKDSGAKDVSIETFPIGIGREGLATPTGKTTIIKKAEQPSWYPTERMKKDNPELPFRVPASASNPLGEYALYFGWPEFRIHGTNKPWGIGRRVSSGCLRMYPEAIEKMFPNIPVGTNVYVVDQPIKIAWIDNVLYMEAHPSKLQSDEIEENGFISKELLDKEIPEDLKKFIIKVAGEKSDKINWEKVQIILEKRQGYPIELINKDIDTPNKDEDESNSQ